jgi:hypothetical protein
MKSSIHRSPTIRRTVAFEISDVSIALVVKSLLALAAVICLLLLVLWPFYLLLVHVQKSGTGEQPTLHPAMLPPEPRLQGAPGHQEQPEVELQKLRSDAESVLDSFGWIDKTNGIARIPIDEAMRIVAEENAAPSRSTRATAQGATTPANRFREQAP